MSMDKKPGLVAVIAKVGPCTVIAWAALVVIATWVDFTNEVGGFDHVMEIFVGKRKVTGMVDSESQLVLGPYSYLCTLLSLLAATSLTVRWKKLWYIVEAVVVVLWLASLAIPQG